MKAKANANANANAKDARVGVVSHKTVRLVAERSDRRAAQVRDEISIESAAPCRGGSNR